MKARPIAVTSTKWRRRAVPSTRCTSNSIYPFYQHMVDVGCGVRVDNRLDETDHELRLVEGRVLGRLRSRFRPVFSTGEGTVAKTDDVFTVFISHKHDDHALAVEVGKALEGLARPKLIDCFVSGSDISAGMDWRREIRNVLAKSHLLVLLYTAPSRSWDWCLYETGLYTRFDRADKNEVSSVVCLFSPGQASPSVSVYYLCRTTWYPGKPARSIACCTNPEALACSMNSLM